MEPVISKSFILRSLHALKKPKSAANLLLNLLPYLGILLVIFMTFETMRTMEGPDKTLDNSIEEQRELRRLIWANLLMQRSTSLAVNGFLKKDPSYFERADVIVDSISVDELKALPLESGSPEALALDEIVKSLENFKLMMNKMTEPRFLDSPEAKTTTVDQLIELADKVGQNLVQIEAKQWFLLQEHNSNLLVQIHTSHKYLMTLYAFFLILLVLMALTTRRKNKISLALKENESVLQAKTIALERAQTLAKLGTWSWDFSADRSDWSNEAKNILGVPERTELKYADFLERIHADDRDFFKAILDHCLETGIEVKTQFRIVTPDGETRECSFVAQTKQTSLNTVLLAILQDVTVQKQAEGLRLERDAAEKANQTKSLFLANISHELRTPMHGILSYARFGQQKIETATKDKLKSYFDEIYDSASRLMTLLNDLLDLSKLEAGKIVYSMKPENLRDIVASVCDEMRALSEEKTLRLEIDSPPEITGTMDAERLMQVVRNLLSNACKFSIPNSVVRIVLRDSDGTLYCQVSNKGIGIPDTEIETIFNKFVQSSKTRTGAGGTGLGLAICREIIQQHGGKIWAESVMNEETIFCFEIPKHAVAPAEAAG